MGGEIEVGGGEHSPSHIELMTIALLHFYTLVLLNY